MNDAMLNVNNNLLPTFLTNTDYVLSMQQSVKAADSEKY